MIGHEAEPIAITGIGCRFPGGASSPSKLWELLKNPPDLRSEIPSSRFSVKGFHHSDGTKLGTGNVTHSYLLNEDYSAFDYEFFKIHPREAESMDPQQRIFLEVIYEGLESAGYSMECLRGSSTAVFVGQMMDDYYDMVNRDVASAPQYTATGTCRAIVANRVSYFFDWHGPSVSLDTACSSSLVAMHQAVQALRNKESHLAIVGGVNLILGPENYIYESTLGMLSPTGRSRMWDASADGYARGEGFAALVLKPLSSAVADGDRIEAVIRETGVNQDGRSAGLTVPSPSAQTALIQSTYRRAGLDCRKREDRCQFFEAHGTGTLAGDPKEAEAIQKAFFSTSTDTSAERLVVGSIKTVMGHAEGAAGIAGVIRAVLALKHAAVPPNLHFNKLNPAIEPFYDSLTIPTRLQPWPDVPGHGCRRASVNSFGFGGTNAHAILESWNPEVSAPTSSVSDDVSMSAYGPFVVSARSERDLARATAALSESLKSGSVLNLRDLAWTLQTRRDHFPYRSAFSATCLDELVDALDVSNADSSLQMRATKVSTAYPGRILGVFTGQGAQWPRMGAHLLLESECFRHSIQFMQDSLDKLPDAPSWTLAGEILAPAASSRISLAEISQPVCTAVQLALVDLLNVSGVTFAGVVGHSSGEIAAAYAAGHLLLEDGIRIAYYRGVHSKLARQDGSMMAVGMSYAPALEFCANARFHGRIEVAASNSNSSVTISGDTEMIDKAKEELDETKVFARKLKVDKAYHSKHMISCSEAYLESLQRCQVQPQSPQAETNCVWYSSVWGSNGRRLTDLSTLRDTYWNDNLVKPVLFSQSIARAVQEGQCFDLVLEVGPHPALKGPALDTMRTLTGVNLPYCGTLKRSQNDMVAFSDALGFIWTNIDSPTPLPDFGAFAKACNGQFKADVCADIPSYCWNHDRPMLRESRISKNWRMQQTPNHELLGVPVSIGGGREVRWRKIMILSEMEWLKGHRFQKQVLFPAAGYISMATEAARHIAQEQPIRLIELKDMDIHRAITLDPNSSGMEITFVVKITQEDVGTMELEYSCYSADADAMVHQQEQFNFSGQATLYKGSSTDHELPPRSAPVHNLVDVDLDTFYAWISKVGLDYSGDFLVDSLRRRLGFSTITMSQSDNGGLLIHPTTLDASFHGVFGAFCYPDDDRMWTAYLPTKVRRVRIPIRDDPLVEVSRVREYVGDCWLRDASEKLICADVEIFASHGIVPEVQIEGLTCMSFKQAHPSDDRLLFTHTAWMKDISSGIDHDMSWGNIDEEVPYDVLERTAFFYLRGLRREIADGEIPSMDWHFRVSLEWAFHRLLPRIDAGKHSRIKPEWESDGLELISSWETQYGHDVTLQLIHTAGKAYPAMARGETPALQVLRANDLLDRFYKECACMRHSNRVLGHIFGQITHRYPTLKVLEIGGGTGGTTEMALQTAAGRLESYTFTDISAGFFEKATAKFSEHGDKMKFKTLDVSECPLKQGFEEGSFDVIIAANVLHATKSLKDTMENCRKVLKPGGYLLLMEITGDTLWVQFGFSSLPGWWLGQEEGRTDSPTIPRSEWDLLLKRTGFSGTEKCYRDSENETEHTVSVIVSQASSPIVEALKSPFTAADDLVLADEVVVVSGTSNVISAWAREAESLLGPLTPSITIVDGLEDPRLEKLKLGSAVLCLCELEEAAWKQMSEQKFAGIKSIFNHASRVVWATRGARADEPYANMVTGLGRSVKQELPHMNIQFVDFEPYDISSSSSSPARVASRLLLQMLCRDLPGAQDVLWTDETEVMVMGESLFIPRIIPTAEPNDRLNSGRRIIDRPFSPRDHPIRLTESAGAIVAQHEDYTDSDSVTSEMRVDYCSTVSFQSSEGVRIWLVGGSIQPHRTPILAISASNASISRVLPHQTFKCSRTGEHSIAMLRKAIATLFCHYLFSGLDGTLWLHDADTHFNNVASEYAARRGGAVFLSSSNSGGHAAFIHPHTPERTLMSQVPSGVARVAIFTTNRESSFIDLAKSIVNEKDIVQIDKLFGFGAVIPLELDTKEVSHILTQVIETYDPSSVSGFPPMFRADEMITAKSTTNPLGLIMWADIEKIPVRTQAIDTRCLFSSEKTYFLVGLSREVGLSLCEWMVRNGARHLAITSRSPKISLHALQSLKNGGAQVRVFPLDIADDKALREVYHEITSTMPPVAGVANAAMVLRDKPFSGMGLNDFEYVLGPKVRGSENLDRLFHSTKLDFFILFSSLSRVVGNAGQSNYAAANMYMTSLVNQRQQRGVVGSVIDIAILVGLGYIHRLNDVSLESQMRQAGYMPLSEPDLHTIFAEAIQAGLPGSSMDPVIQTGLRRSAKAPWSRIPRFSHMAVADQLTAQKRETAQGPGSTLREKLASANGGNETLDVLQTEFCKKIGSMLGIDIEKINKEAPLVSLGIDSLVAVELRSWCLAELMIDVPVLRVLGGASLTDICLEVRRGLGEIPTERKGESIKGLLKPPGSPETVAQTPDSRDSTTPLSPSLLSESKTPSERQQTNSSSVTDSDTESSSTDGQRSSKARTELRRGPVSHSQEALYFLHEYLRDKSSQNVSYHGRFRGSLDRLRFKQAIQTVAHRHEALRSSYVMDPTTHRPLQVVHDQPQIDVTWKDIDGELSVRGEIAMIRSYVFRIEQGDLMKVLVLSETPSLHHMVFVHHHIVLDASAWFIFIKELDLAYSSEQLSLHIQQAIDVTKTREERCTAEKLAADLEFWAKMHQVRLDPLPLFPFSKIKTRHALTDYESETIEIPFSSELSSHIRTAAAKLHVTPFHFFLGTLSSLLGKCLQVDKLNIGIVDANRADPDTAMAMGSYLNLLPLRMQVNPQSSFRKMVQGTRDSVVSGMTHSRAPFGMILDHLHVARSSDHHPLFQVLVNYRLGFSKETALDKGKIEWIGGLPSKNAYDLEFDITTPSQGPGLMSVTGQKYLFAESDLKLILQWYCRALEGYARKPDLSIGQCPISNEQDIEQALKLGKGPKANIEWEGTLIHRVENMAHRYADSPAIKHGEGQTVTYAEMMDIVVRICRDIHAKGLQPGRNVGMLLHPSADAICTLLAVMRCGLVWVPLDLRNHVSRLSSIASESDLQLLICAPDTMDLAKQLVGDKSKISCLSDEDRTQYSGSQPGNGSNPSQNAALLYTSGSTGVPKGVKLGHSALSNQILVNKQLFDVQREVVLQQTSYGFDIVLDQIFQALANGGVLVVVSQEGRGDPQHIARLMAKEGVTYTHVVPSEYQMLVQYGADELKTCHAWRIAMAAGEKITHRLRKAFQTLGLEHVHLINAYGPTEATVTCARGEIPYRAEDEMVARSDWLRPLPNYELLIMTEDMTPAPIGFPGELYIRGIGVAQGYTNNDEETRRSFIHVANDDDGGVTRMYRTGDLARLLEDGTMTTLGRIAGDTQVKIRGQRVELDEIAATIVRASDGVIVDAAVIWKGELEILAAFVVFDPSFHADKMDYITQLRNALPVAPYMCPSYIAPVSHIPSNANGKQDRRRIDSWPIEQRVCHGSVPASAHTLTETEERLLAVWKQVINNQLSSQHRVDATADFFHMGGNSTLLIKLRSIIESSFSTRLKLFQLFRSSTLGSMADLITSSRDSSTSIDWAKEVESLIGDLPQPHMSASPPADNGMVVILTGSTGFLGGNLLQKLVEDPRVSEVHCVAIRPRSHPREHPLPTSGQHAKVVEHSGDLEDHNLGLTQAEFQDLRDRGNLIIHNGAQVSFMRTYSTLRNVNVLATKTICHLAIPRRIPIHFVSTASVATIANGSEPLSEVSLLNHTPEPDSKHGYRDSKWVSETLLENAQRLTGTPVWIHRPTTITGEGAPDLDLVTMLIKYSRVLGVVPMLDVSMVQGRLDLVSVDSVAGAIHEVALSPAGSDMYGSITTKYVHHCGGFSFPPSELHLYLESIDQRAYEVVELPAWLESALDRGLSRLIYDFMVDSFRDGGLIELPVLVK
ncbi:beta-ketoacyl synthase domain-containing protein [Xylariomycetidae sp. FL2044]|nr:beta-ketoacyl synthase domain-containing protein [Xylariomycetidae sp. FL2044]